MSSNGGYLISFTFLWIHHGRDEKEMESSIYRMKSINKKHELLKIV
jgi:3-polyprenyl-4-hydroxybenzoate decarboxylase